MAGSGKLKFEDLEPVGPGAPVGRYLRLFWQPVMRARDLPAGRARPLEILGEHFTIFRAEDGTARVVAHRCPHRGTPLSLGWVEGETLRCRYHGWKFDGEGQCVEQPNEDRPFCDKVRMASHPTREYAGLVFAHLGEGAPPPFPRYPDMDRPGVVITDPVEVLPCTFWNRFDNDHCHIPWVHRATALRRNRPDLLVIRHEAVEETPYGWRGIRSIKGEAGEAESALGPAKLTHWFMPNVRLFWAPTRAAGFEGRGLWDTKMVWTVPVNDAAHAAFDVTHTPVAGADARAFAASRARQEAEAETRWDLAEAVLAGEMALEDLPADMDAYTSFAIEDYCTQVGQGPVKGRGREHLAPTDARLVLLRRLWLREVGALIEGKPLTDWRMPEQPLRLDAAKGGKAAGKSSATRETTTAS
jgi:5,5'-dehydrodivanillate O-demethylase